MVKKSRKSGEEEISKSGKGNRKEGPRFFEKIGGEPTKEGTMNCLWIRRCTIHTCCVAWVLHQCCTNHPAAKETGAQAPGAQALTLDGTAIGNELVLKLSMNLLINLIVNTFFS